jgi:hypothetical protein
MYKIKYKIAEFIVNIQLFFSKKYSYQYYQNLYLLEDIVKEGYIEKISKQTKTDWTNFYI